MTNKLIGKQGETLAKDFLIKNGYKILEMNYKYSRLAEIDIIASKNNIIHFVEVKTRTGTAFGLPLEAINKKKFMSIYNCAQYYMKSKNIRLKYQIDAIGILLETGKQAQFQHLENISL